MKYYHRCCDKYAMWQRWDIGAQEKDGEQAETRNRQSGEV